MQELKALEVRLSATPEKQISLTDPDARSMKTRGTGIVGYNAQIAVEPKHHLIVANEVTNDGVDRSQLSSMAQQARRAMGSTELTAVADRGYFKGEEILACEQAGITAIVPKPLTSSSTRPRGASASRTSSTWQTMMSTVARRAALNPALCHRRKRDDLAGVLELRVPRLPAQGPMHHGPGAAHQTLGARGGIRSDASSAGSRA